MTVTTSVVDLDSEDTFSAPSPHTLDAVDVTFDDQRLVADAGLIQSERLRAHLVELAGMTPRERAQERAYRRRRQHHMAQHRLRRPGPERTAIIDRVATSERGVDHRHCFVPTLARPAVTHRLTWGVSEQLPQPETLGQHHSRAWAAGARRRAATPTPGGGAASF